LGQWVVALELHIANGIFRYDFTKTLPRRVCDGSAFPMGLGLIFPNKFYVKSDWKENTRIDPMQRGNDGNGILKMFHAIFL
jgi:hypothetical protein